MITLKQKLLTFADEKFKNQMNLNISDILTLTNDKYYITSDNKMGLSIGSLSLKLNGEEHKKMATLLTLISEDSNIT